jgi:hypothetical protein
MAQCNICKGKGEIKEVCSNCSGHRVNSWGDTCYYCDQGRIVVTCPACRGAGHTG